MFELYLESKVQLVYVEIIWIYSLYWFGLDRYLTKISNVER